VNQYVAGQKQPPLEVICVEFISILWICKVLQQTRLRSDAQM